MSAILKIPTLSRSLIFNPPLTDEESEKLCLASENAQLERTKEGWIEVNPPAAGFASDGDSEITYQLRAWWHSHKRGRVFDSSAGLFLQDGSMLSPDAAYIRKINRGKSLKKKVNISFTSARSSIPACEITQPGIPQLWQLIRHRVSSAGKLLIHGNFEANSGSCSQNLVERFGT